MKVNVTYTDNSSFTGKEIKKNLQFLLGDNIDVEFSPNSDDPKAHVYFGLEQIINEIQIAEYFDSERGVYESRMAAMKEEILNIVASAIDDIIQRNEDKVECL
jgi:hypothetical protein